MGFKSHSMEAIKEAFENGLTIWNLDTATSGGDDILIQESDMTGDDILGAVLYHHEIDELPENWSLTKIESLDEIY